MKLPLIISRPGTLDVFDDVEDLAQRYPSDALAGKDVTVWDGDGRLLKVRRGADWRLQFEAESLEPLRAEKLAQILREHLQRGGMSVEQSRSMGLSALIVKVYPPPYKPRRRSWRALALIMASPVFRRMSRLRFGWMIIGTVCGAIFGLIDGLSAHISVRDYWLAAGEFHGAVFGAVAGALLGTWLNFRRRAPSRRFYRLRVFELITVTAILVPLWQYHREAKARLDDEIHRTFEMIRALPSSMSPEDTEKAKRQLSAMERIVTGSGDASDWAALDDRKGHAPAGAPNPAAPNNARHP